MNDNEVGGYEKAVEVSGQFLGGTPVRRKWGYYVDHLRSPDYVVKTLVLDPGKGISVQKHNQRDEYWTIVEGAAGYLMGDDPCLMQGGTLLVGETLRVITTEWHYLFNLSTTEPLIVSEVQIATDGVCSEDDIERYTE